MYRNGEQDPELDEFSYEPLYNLYNNEHHKIGIQELIQRDKGLQDNFIWKVLADGEQIPLEEGDWIKIGKVKMKFKEIVSSPSPNRGSTVINSDRDETERMDITSPQMETVKTHPEGQCRICFENSDTI